jgi:hypothetical protein
MSTPWGDAEADGGSWNDEFTTGHQGDDPANRATSLDLDSERQNAETPHSFTANSVLQQLMPSANGLGASDTGRLLPSGQLLPTENGSSSGSYEKNTMLRLEGQDVE